MPPELTGLPPIAREDARILILGSFPGERSLAEGRYYAHPQNQFWLLLAAVWPEVRLPRQYSARIRWLQARRIALWDVYGACRRQGSLDSAIEAARLNDLLGLVARLPRLERVACNGGLAYRVARRVLGSTGMPIAILPSSSPANASWSFERKVATWRARLRGSREQPVSG